MKKNKLKFFFIFLILLIFIKTDYRLEGGIYCCKDDHDYYAHAETLAIDFDFDYSNQLVGNEQSRFYFDGKSAPSAFFGAGLLSAPFLFLGNVLDNLFQNNNLYNFKILLYSFSSIFYLIFSMLLLYKISMYFNIKYNPLIVYLYVIGSGIGFYAFERYSMSHVYELFSITLLFYYCLKFYTQDLNYFTATLIPLLVMVAIMTRWVNIYVFLVPYIVSKIVKNSKNSLLLNKFFLASSLFSIFIFLYHTYLIFGVVTINPEFTYNTSGTLSNFIARESNLFLFIFNNLKNLLLLLFGPEFGLIWFSPIIFFGLYICLKNIIFNKDRLFNFLIVFCFMQIFALVLIWKSTGSSYGYRYTLNLVPLSLIVLFFQNHINKIEEIYLKAMSGFSILSVIFFETTLSTQLSLEYIENMYGKITKFTQPDYLFGFFNSFSELEAYLKIFAQSYLGFFVFYIFVYVLGIDKFYQILDTYALPYQNEDFQILISKIQLIELSKFIVSLFLIFLLTYLLSSFKPKNEFIKIESG